MARNVFSVFGVLMILGGLLSESIVGILALIPGFVLIYLWWSLRNDAPNRELNLSQRVPFLGNLIQSETEQRQQSKGQSREHEGSNQQTQNYDQQQ